MFKTFSDFEAIGKMVCRKAEYNRSRKLYTAVCEFGEARGWGDGPTPGAAQWNATRKCYAALRQQAWRESVLDHYAPFLRKAEKRLRSWLNSQGASLTRFRPVWTRHNVGAAWLGEKKRVEWRLDLSVEYTIDPHGAYPIKRRSMRGRLPAQFESVVEGILADIMKLDFDMIRFAQKHDAHKQVLRRIGQRTWDKFSRCTPTQAQPGDYLVREYGYNRGSYVQLVSVSPTGAVVKVRKFSVASEPDVIRLTGQDKIVKYIHLTKAQFEARKRLSEKHHAMTERLEALVDLAESLTGN